MLIPALITAILTLAIVLLARSHRRAAIILLTIGSLLTLFFLLTSRIGGTCGFCPSPPRIMERYQQCIGLAYTLNTCIGCLDAGSDIYCLGMVRDAQHCYTRINGTRIEVPDCKNPATWQEVLALCPSCLHQAYQQAEQNSSVTAFCVAHSDFIRCQER